MGTLLAVNLFASPENRRVIFLRGRERCSHRQDDSHLGGREGGSKSRRGQETAHPAGQGRRNSNSQRFLNTENLARSSHLVIDILDTKTTHRVRKIPSENPERKIPNHQHSRPDSPSSVNQHRHRIFRQKAILTPKKGQAIPCFSAQDRNGGFTKVCRRNRIVGPQSGTVEK